MTKKMNVVDDIVNARAPVIARRKASPLGRHEAIY